MAKSSGMMQSTRFAVGSGTGQLPCQVAGIGRVSMSDCRSKAIVLRTCIPRYPDPADGNSTSVLEFSDVFFFFPNRLLGRIGQGMGTADDVDFAVGRFHGHTGTNRSGIGQAIRKVDLDSSEAKCRGLFDRSFFRAIDANGCLNRVG